jgi:hypothetical protein
MNAATSTTKPRSNSRPSAKAPPSLTVERLLEVLDFDDASEEFRWRRRPGNDRATNTFNTRFAGKLAGQVNGKGVRIIYIDRQAYVAPRLVRFLKTGAWEPEPPGPLTADRLRTLLDFDPETGRFTWKPRPETHRGAAIFNSRYAGKKAGCPDHYGYIQLTVDGRNHKAHRLAWLWVHGTFPPADKEIDHRDHNRANNAIGNLRLATHRQNTCNTGARKPGHHKGCHWSPRDRKWSAWIYVDGRKVSLGAFKRLDDAKAARFQAEAKHHGEWAYTAEPERRAA